MKAPNFLTLAEILEIHKNQIELYGGETGMRDLGLLESAINQPEASFGGEWLHKTIFEMAAAYAFHIAKNHPFVDGNKRAALASALVFLELNGISVRDSKGKLYDVMIKLTTSQISKQEFGKILKKMEKKSK